MKNPLVSHTVIGAFIGYFLFHPITMVIYHFTHHSQIHSTIEPCDLIFMAFRMDMFPMALLYSFLGGFVGWGYGHYSKIIINKNKALHEREQQLQNQVLVIQKQASLGVMAGSIGHEIKNILVPIMGYCGIIQDESDASQELKKNLAEIFSATFKLDTLAKALLNLGRPNDIRLESVDVCKIINSTTDTLIVCGVLKRIKIKRNLPENNRLMIQGDPFLLEQVIRNIELNAVQAMNNNGALTIVAGEDPVRKGVYFEIKDSGPGISPSHMACIFDPFFTTQKDGKGNGLGLCVVKEIIEGLGGDIKAFNSNDGGAVFAIFLPYL